MSDLTSSISVLRESVVAILRIRLIRPQPVKKGNVRPAQFQASLGGSGFCVVADRYLVTAFHVLNGGQARDTGDKYYAFMVPGNGEAGFHFPVISFPLERSEVDIAVLEIGSCTTAGVHVPAVPVSFVPQADGERVVTVGFPSPEIAGLNVDAQGNYIGGQFFLKSHANEGIISAQYVVGDVRVYELNVGWHHGESGGPIAVPAATPVVFSLMQHYRNVQSPHGTVAGPHCGRALSAVQHELTDLGVTTA